MMSGSKQKIHAGYGCEDVDPRGFVSLMDLYENNYMRLRRLIPDLQSLPLESVSALPGCMSLHLSILERTRFTSTLYLTYVFEEDDQYKAEPALTIRVYHDAHQLEVLTGHLQHGRQHFDHIPEKAIETKWKLNRFLYKWLGFCLYIGHHFPAEKPTSVPQQKQLQKQPQKQSAKLLDINDITAVKSVK